MATKCNHRYNSSIFSKYITQIITNEWSFMITTHIHASKGPMLCETSDSIELWLLLPRSCWGKQKLASSGRHVGVGPPGCFFSLWVAFLCLHFRKRIVAGIADTVMQRSPKMKRIAATLLSGSLGNTVGLISGLGPQITSVDELPGTIIWWSGVHLVQFMQCWWILSLYIPGGHGSHSPFPVGCSPLPHSLRQYKHLSVPHRYPCEHPQTVSLLAVQFSFTRMPSPVHCSHFRQIHWLASGFVTGMK